MLDKYKKLDYNKRIKSMKLDFFNKGAMLNNPTAKKADNIKEVYELKFKELLKEVDMNGAQLARRLDVSVAAVSAWCTGKSAPNYDRLPEIAKVLNVSIDKVVECFV